MSVWIICFIQDFIEGSADCPLEPSAQSSVASCPAQCPMFQPSAQCSSPVPSVPVQCPVFSRPAPSPDCGPVQIVQSSPDAAQFVDLQYLFLILSLRFLMAVYLQSCATQLCYRVVLLLCFPRIQRVSISCVFVLFVR